MIKLHNVYLLYVGSQIVGQFVVRVDIPQLVAGTIHCCMCVKKYEIIYKHTLCVFAILRDSVELRSRRLCRPRCT
jgi:hypothetical protein